MKWYFYIKEKIEQFFEWKFIFFTYLFVSIIFFSLVGFSKWIIFCFAAISYVHLMTRAYLDGDIFPANYVYPSCPEETRDFVRFGFGFFCYLLHIAVACTVIFHSVLRYYQSIS